MMELHTVNGGMEGDKAVLVPRGNGGGKKGMSDRS